MAIQFVFTDLPWTDLLESLLPDFLLGLAFFTALAYTVLGRRLEQEKPAAIMSVCLGATLALALVWWELANEVSIRNLGSVAILLIVLILAAVIYQAVRRIGGSWAGAGIAAGLSLFIAALLNPSWPIRDEVIGGFILFAMTAGVIAFVVHVAGRHRARADSYAEIDSIRHDMSDLYADRTVADRVRSKLRLLQRTSRTLRDPVTARQVHQQVHDLLPAEGSLADRLTQLRRNAELIKRGHLHRVEELRHVVEGLPRPVRKEMAREMAARLKELRLDDRMDRLDRAVAENERRVRELTVQANGELERYQYAHVPEFLEEAEKLQDHNDRLLKRIERTEKRLLHTARHAASGSISSH